MLRILFVGAALASLSLSLKTTAAQGRGNLAQSREAVANGWQFDYQAANEQARASNKPLMIVFRCVP